MTDRDIHEPLEVKRVHTENGSHIEPAMDTTASELDQLRWHAGVMKADTGITLYITTMNERPEFFGTLVRMPGGSWSTAMSHFGTTWFEISKMAYGARIAQELARAKLPVSERIKRQREINEEKMSKRHP